jgi:hypothetical protein|tara:strand:+ start:680 stop:892 length:213 start_codon:yes stop_codon:yes gene_type:complete
MTEVVIALMMILNGNVIEFTYKEKMSDCLKSKRIASREVRPERVQFVCKQVNAVTEVYMNRKKIVKIIKE